MGTPGDTGHQGTLGTPGDTGHTRGHWAHQGTLGTPGDTGHTRGHWAQQGHCVQQGTWAQQGTLCTPGDMGTPGDTGHNRDMGTPGDTGYNRWHISVAQLSTLVDVKLDHSAAGKQFWSTNDMDLSIKVFVLGDSACPLLPHVQLVQGAAKLAREVCFHSTELQTDSTPEGLLLQDGG